MNSDLPRNWCKTTIGEVFSITLGQSPPSSTYNGQGEGLPFFQGKAEFEDLYPVPRKWCSSPKKIAQKGDVLLSVRAPVGPTNIAPEECCIGRGLASIRPVNGMETKFVLYFFRSIERYLEKSGTGTTFNAITGDKLKNLSIFLPPLKEQHRIVAKMEELFTKLDAGVESLKQVQAQLKCYRQSILKAAVEGRLTAEWREQHKDELEPADKLLERIQEEKKKRLDTKYKVPKSPDTGKSPELPENWKYTTLKSISDVIHYGYTASSSSKLVGPKLLRITDIQKGKVIWNNVPFCEIENEIKNKYLLKSGDLVFARTGATVGKSYLIRDDVPEAVFASYLIRVILNEKVDNHFIYSFFQSPQYWVQIVKGQLGIGQPNVNATTLSNLVIPLPPFKEQEMIKIEVDRLLSIADKMDALIELELRHAQSLRQSILKRAFEGKLVLQDPSDEPASVLLEKIKAEKANITKTKQLEMC